MKNYSCSFKPDKINYLLGKNGTGKSTTFYLILGILLPQKGTIVLTTDKGVYNLRDLNLDH
jgi:ABC-type Mn2+/Zn2+ transport system ATPase subunit